MIQGGEVIYLTPIDLELVKELQGKLDASLKGEHRWTAAEISYREHLRIRIACAKEGRHYGEAR